MIDTEAGGGVPQDWDRLAERAGDSPALGDRGAAPSPASPPTLTIMAASWGDALAILIVCTAELALVHALGHGYGLATVSWAGLAAFTWWLLASAALLVIRQGSVGMLMAGIVNAETIPPRRIPCVLLAAVVSALLIGAPAILGPRRHPLSVAAGAPLVLAGSGPADMPPGIRRGA